MTQTIDARAKTADAAPERIDILFVQFDPRCGMHQVAVDLDKHDIIDGTEWGTAVEELYRQMRVAETHGNGFVLHTSKFGKIAGGTLLLTPTMIRDHLTLIAYQTVPNPEHPDVQAAQAMIRAAQAGMVPAGPGGQPAFGLPPSLTDVQREVLGL